MKLVSIYVLIDSRDNKPFYVGATNSKLQWRLTQHIRDCRYKSIYEPIENRHKLIKDIIASGNSIEIICLLKCTEYAAKYCERKIYSLLVMNGYNLLQSKNNLNRCVLKLLQRYKTTNLITQPLI